MPATTSTNTVITTSRPPRPMPRTFERIRLVLGAIAGALLLAAPSSSPAQDEGALRATPDGRPLMLVFADEFNTFRPWTGRSGVWRTRYGNDSHTGLDGR